MIIDTSILLHIAFGEEHWERSLSLLTRKSNLLMSTVSVVEAHAVITYRNNVGDLIIDEILSMLNIDAVSFDKEQMVHAKRAYSVYGKGNKSKVKLNFGDCLVYGLSKSRNEVLAFVGNDFNYTDLDAVRFPIVNNFN